jgi:hypothetical protein
MDDLVLAGAVGIIGLFLAAIFLFYGIYSIAVLIYASAISGRYSMVLIILLTLLAAGLLYTAAGIWLQKTGRI